MKLLLLLNSSETRSGYVNVDPFAPPDDTTRVKCNIDNLNPVCDGGELEELVAHDVLDFVQASKADAVLTHWISKLAHGGKISLSVVDLGEVCRGYLSGALSLETANNLLHADQTEPWEIRKATYTLSVLCEFLENKGLKIVLKKLTNHRAVVTAERP